MTRSTGRRNFIAYAVFATALGLLAGGCQRSEPPAKPPAAGSTEPQSPAPAPVPGAAADVGAADAAPPEGVLRAYVWGCEDGRKLTMRNLFQERAIAIDFHEGTKRLDQVVSASGARYANADESVVFWTKGSAATLEQQGAPPVKCNERRAESLREDARARGVVYRALGNEPGWTLEIGPGARLEWVTNFGADRHVFEAAQELPAAPAGTGRTFEATSGNESIKATVTAEPCTDDGDVTYDHSAVVEFGGTTLRGCGTRLN